MQIRTTDTFSDDLDDFARRAHGGTFYHSGAWINSLIKAFPNWSFRCLVADDNSGVHGYLPFFLVKHGPVRAAWSMPFGTYGGPVTAVEDAAIPLIQAYENVLSRSRVLQIAWIDFGNTGRTVRSQGAACETHLVDISCGFETVWEEKIERQRKKRKRRAERLGVTIRKFQSADDMSRYYAIYSDRIEQWGGGDKYPLRLFQALLSHGDSVRMYLAFHEDDFLGGHINFYFRNMVTSWNGVTAVESHHLQPDTLLYIHCMREACEEGFTVYNLGGSLGKPSLIDFKESLGGVPHRYTQYQRRSLLGSLAAGLKRIGG